MTLLQALVALALFAPGAVAPRAGLDVRQLSMFATAVFAVSLGTSFWGGGLVARLGSLRIATLCATAIIVSMGLAATGADWALLPAGLALGLAAGPETPASSALLGRLVSADRRALVFSIRQTGNQLGAIIGSLSLPVLAILLAPSYAFLAVAACAAGAIALFETLRPAYPAAGAPPPQLGVRERVRLVASDRRLATLALASMPYSALQVALNTCFVSFGTFELGLSHVEAGAALAAAQAGGLVGRVGWGLVAVRLSARRVLVLTGIGMATAALVFGISGALLGKPAQFALAGLFGLTASGWNGVFIAEIARLAPVDRVAETTGAVLTASFAGLLLAPLLIAGLDRLAGLGGAFIALGLLSAGAALALSRDYERI